MGEAPAQHQGHEGIEALGVGLDAMGARLVDPEGFHASVPVLGIARRLTLGGHGGHGENLRLVQERPEAGLYGGEVHAAHIEGLQLIVEGLGLPQGVHRSVQQQAE